MKRPFPLYFDYNATTPCDQSVIAAMLPYFNMHFGNPSSSQHMHGWIAHDAVEKATCTISDALGVPLNSLIYTSGATESINMIIKGVVKQTSAGGNHIVTSKAEHKAVLDTCRFLEQEGCAVTYLDVDSRGLINTGELRKAIRPETTLVALMCANNETGAIQPLHEIAAIAKANNAVLFSDATQALGKIDLKAVIENVDFSCFSGHKIYGPKGIGLVYARHNETATALNSFIQGGGQQKGQRGGTLNTPGIVGMAEALKLSVQSLDQEMQRIGGLRNKLEDGLLSIEMAVCNSTTELRLPNTTNISFKYVDGDSLLRALRSHISVSNGSACNSASVEPSHVLSAMGIDRSLAKASLRLSIGRYTTEKEIDRAIEIVRTVVAEQRKNNILWERK